MNKLKLKDLLLIPIIILGVKSVIAISHSGDVPSTVTLGLVFASIIGYWVFRIIKPKHPATYQSGADIQTSVWVGPSLLRFSDGIVGALSYRKATLALKDGVLSLKVNDWGSNPQHLTDFDVPADKVAVAKAFAESGALRLAVNHKTYFMIFSNPYYQMIGDPFGRKARKWFQMIQSAGANKAAAEPETAQLQKHHKLKRWLIIVPSVLIGLFIVLGVIGGVVKNPVKLSNVYAPKLSGYYLKEFHNYLGNSPDGSYVAMDYEAIGQEGHNYAVNDNPFVQLTEFDKSWGSFTPPSNCGIKYPLGSSYWIFSGKKLNGNSFYDKVPCHRVKDNDGVQIYASDNPKGGDDPAYYVVYKTEIITLFQNSSIDFVSSVVSSIQPTTIQDLQSQAGMVGN